MTPEQIEKLRDDIKDRQPWYDDGEINDLCNLALKGIAQPEAGDSKLLTVAKQVLEKLKFLEVEGIVQMPMTILALQQAILEAGSLQPQPDEQRSTASDGSDK